MSTRSLDPSHLDLVQLAAAEERWDDHEGQDTQVNAASGVKYSLLESVDNKCTERKGTVYKTFV